MGYFDFLITPGHKPEKKEYLFVDRRGKATYAAGHKPGLSDAIYEHLDVEVPCIITDVEQSKSGYTFGIKGKEGRFWTSYGWAIAENTPENIERIEEAWAAQDRTQESQRETARLFKRINTLERRTENTDDEPMGEA